MAASARLPLNTRVGQRRVTTTNVADPAQPGRPVSRLGNYLLKPTARSFTGYEMLNTEPTVLERVNQQYMKRGQLPPALQPKYLRQPEVLDQGRRNAISRGWNRPNSLQG